MEIITGSCSTRSGKEAMTAGAGLFRHFSSDDIRSIRCYTFTQSIKEG